MIKTALLFISLLLLSACSFKSPPNQWQYKSATAFDSYTTNFLSAHDTLAKNDLSRAIKHAKQSADLRMLARVYLGVCALNISVGIDDDCKDYLLISDLVHDKSLDAYYSFITLKPKYLVENLSSQYRDFALAIRDKNFAIANSEILTINKATSKLLAAALIKDKLSEATRDEIINIASFYGYKKSILFWLNEAMVNTVDEDKRKNLSKKISILNSGN